MIVYNYTGYVNRELKEIIVGGIFQGGRIRQGFALQAAICGRLGEALKSDAYGDFHEGQPTLVNIVGVGD